MFLVGAVLAFIAAANVDTSGWFGGMNIGRKIGWVVFAVLLFGVSLGLALAGSRRVDEESAAPKP